MAAASVVALAGTVAFVEAESLGGLELIRLPLEASVGSSLAEVEMQVAGPSALVVVVVEPSDLVVEPSDLVVGPSDLVADPLVVASEAADDMDHNFVVVLEKVVGSEPAVDMDKAVDNFHAYHTEVVEGAFAQMVAAASDHRTASVPDNSSVVAVPDNLSAAVVASSSLDPEHSPTASKIAVTLPISSSASPRLFT